MLACEKLIVDGESRSELGKPSAKHGALMSLELHSPLTYALPQIVN